MRSPVPVVFLIGVGLVLLSSQSAVAQSAFVGYWILVVDSVSGHIPDLPPPPELAITSTDDRITVKKGEMPVETYRTNGSETDLEGFRKARPASPTRNSP